MGIGFDNCMFNIEMMYDAEADLISIIEINPRMASQFADLYEKVDGTNAYEILLDIAFGLRPEPKRRQGPHRFAASCVLRAFEDCRIGFFPSDAEIERLAFADPDVRVELHGATGRLLSEEMNDGQSYRYGIVNLGGRDRGDVLRKFEACQALDLALGGHFLFGRGRGKSSAYCWIRLPYESVGPTPIVKVIPSIVPSWGTPFPTVKPRKWMRWRSRPIGSMAETHSLIGAQDHAQSDLDRNGGGDCGSRLHRRQRACHARRHQGRSGGDGEEGGCLDQVGRTG